MKLFLILLGFSLGFSQNKNIATNIPNHYKELQYTAFSYTPPHPNDYKQVLVNGATVFLLPDSSLPVIELKIIFLEKNQSNTPLDVTGLSILSPMYRRGGTLSLTPSQVEDSLEFISAQLGGGLGNYQSSMYLNTMSKDFYQQLKLLSEMFVQPRFDSTQLEILKSQIQENLKHKWDKPSAIGSDFYSHMMYENHPSNWISTPSNVNKIDKNFLINLAKGRFTPHDVVIGVSGSFDKKEMLKALNHFFNNWPKPKISRQIFEDPVLRSKPGIHIIDHPASQAQIQLGQPFLQRPHKDYYTASLASYILGAGGFTSRLVAKIRTEEGLVYGIRSFTASNYSYAATCGVKFQTKAVTATRALYYTLAEIERLITEGPTDDELARAKQGMIASLPRMFDTPANTIDSFVYSAVRKRDPDHFIQYPKALAKITKNDIKRIMQKYFSPEKMTITIVGPKDKLLLQDSKTGKKLSDIGAITWHKLSEMESLGPQN